LLLVLFVVIPVFNPELLKSLDERLYLGTVVVLAAGVLMLPSLRRFSWIVFALVFAALYVAETGLLHRDFRLGIIGNAYRPAHAVLTFSVCAVFLAGADRDRWIKLFLLGGFVGCSLAAVHAAFPAIDPFSPSRPRDIGFASYFLKTRREEGAFVYPGNLGPYGAYVAIVALVMIERRRLRLLSINGYSAAFVAGLLAIAVSGSRGAATGLVFGIAVVLWRSPFLRRPVLIVGTAGLVVAVLVLWQVGKLDEIFTSRLALSGLSLHQRFASWGTAWHAFEKNPLIGGGVIPNTIDSTYLYYLGVGGLLGVLIVAAMYWLTLLRPLRNGDRGSLPIIVAVAAIGVTQEALGTPLTSWAVGAAVYLLARPATVYGTSVRQQQAQTE
jgi:O-antigen ligase/polysaccharide polymerase Wzy-like membrane protein